MQVNHPLTLVKNKDHHELNLEQFHKHNFMPCLLNLIDYKLNAVSFFC